MVLGHTLTQIGFDFLLNRNNYDPPNFETGQMVTNCNVWSDANVKCKLNFGSSDRNPIFSHLSIKVGDVRLTEVDINFEEKIAKKCFFFIKKSSFFMGSIGHIEDWMLC